MSIKSVSVVSKKKNWSLLEQYWMSFISSKKRSGPRTDPLNIWLCMFTLVLKPSYETQSPGIQKEDSSIQWINPHPIDRDLENQFRYPLDREQLGSKGQQRNRSRRENLLFICSDGTTNTGYLCHYYSSIYLYVRTRKMKLLLKQDQIPYSSTSPARKTWTMMW